MDSIGGSSEYEENQEIFLAGSRHRNHLVVRHFTSSRRKRTDFTHGRSRGCPVCIYSSCWRCGSMLWAMLVLVFAGALAGCGSGVAQDVPAKEASVTSDQRPASPTSSGASGARCISAQRPLSSRRLARAAGKWWWWTTIRPMAPPRKRARWRLPTAGCG